MDWLQLLLRDVSALSLWEALAVLLALAYVILAARESLWCWPAAFFSTAIYTAIFWQVALLMESVLNVYYMAMAVYGFWRWQQGRNHHSDIVRWPWQRHALWLTGLAIVALACGYVMANYTHAAFPWLDSATTVCAIFATWLVAQKVLENWLYWIVIDAVSIYLYLQKGLYLTSALFVLYVLLAAWGYRVWRNHYQQLLAH